MKTSQSPIENAGNPSDLLDLANNRAPTSLAEPSRVEVPGKVIGEMFDDLVLPSMLRMLFWDCQFDELRLPHDWSFVMGRVLTSGSWSQIGWLRKRVGDDSLQQWICQREGRPLDPRQLRFWELILDLPTEQVNVWLARRSSNVWDRRNFRDMGLLETGPRELSP